MNVSHRPSSSCDLVNVERNAQNVVELSVCLNFLSPAQKFSEVEDTKPLIFESDFRHILSQGRRNSCPDFSLNAVSLIYSNFHFSLLCFLSSPLHLANYLPYIRVGYFHPVSFACVILFLFIT